MAEYTRTCSVCGKSFISKRHDGRICEVCKIVPRPCSCGCGLIVLSKFAKYAKGCKTVASKGGQKVRKIKQIYKVCTECGKQFRTQSKNDYTLCIDCRKKQKTIVKKKICKVCKQEFIPNVNREGYTPAKNLVLCDNCKIVPRPCGCGKCGLEVKDQYAFYAKACPTQHKQRTITKKSRTYTYNRTCKHCGKTFISNHTREYFCEECKTPHKCKKDGCDILIKTIGAEYCCDAHRPKEMRKSPGFKFGDDNIIKNPDICAKMIAAKTGITPTLSLEEQKVRSIRATNMCLDKNNKFGTSYGKHTKYAGITMRSSWEAKCAKRLDDLQIPWEYEPTYFTYENGTKRYIPDFYIPDLNLYIEVKPCMNIDSIVLAKQKAVQNSGYKCWFLTERNWNGLFGYLENLTK